MLAQRERQEIILKRLDSLGREVELLKRDLIHSLAIQPRLKKPKKSLFGSVKSGDVTEKIIETSKHALFRPLEDI